MYCLHSKTHSSCIVKYNMSSSLESLLKSCVFKSFNCFLSVLTPLHHHMIFFFLFNLNFRRLIRTKLFSFPRETQEGLGLLTNLGLLGIHYRMSHLQVSCLMLECVLNRCQRKEDLKIQDSYASLLYLSKKSDVTSPGILMSIHEKK